jgi:Ca2+-binding EF-hand superfamily protein
MDMKHSKTLVALAVAALIPLAGTAIAGDKDKARSGATFDSLDVNRDGRISQAEAAVDMQIVFSTADANADGYLDNAEFKKARKASSGDHTTPSQPQSQSQSEMPTDATGQPDTNQPDQSAAPPVDTETPRQ